MKSGPARTDAPSTLPFSNYPALTWADLALNWLAGGWRAIVIQVSCAHASYGPLCTRQLVRICKEESFPPASGLPTS